MVVVGKVVRPHGLRGEVVVVPETDFGEQRFAAAAKVWRMTPGGIGALTISCSQRRAGRWVVGFDGVTTVEAAEGLRGAELRIPEDARMPLGPDEYYLYDLVGCRVMTSDGAAVGQVKAVYTGAGGALLGVDRAGEEVLVPLVKAMCPVIDVAGRKIVVDPPEGLLDVNVAEPGAGRKGRGKRR